MIKRTNNKAKITKIKAEKEIVKQKLLAFYQEIWNERPHKSEVSGKWLGKEIKTIFFHHILPKNSAPALMFNKDNIVLLTFEEHQQIEIDENCFEVVNKKRDALLLILLSGAGIISKQ